MTKEQAHQEAMTIGAILAHGTSEHSEMSFEEMVEAISNRILAIVSAHCPNCAAETRATGGE